MPWETGEIARLDYLGFVHLVLVNLAQVLLVYFVAHGADDFVESGDHRRVRDAKLALYIFDLASVLDEGLNELHLVGCEPLCPAQTEDPIYPRAAVAALEARDVQRMGANGADTWHWIHFLSPRT
jgi:hypothetical protein